MTYRVGTTRYGICVDNPDGVNRKVKQLILDNKVLPHDEIPLSDGGQPHDGHILMGRGEKPATSWRPKDT